MRAQKKYRYLLLAMFVAACCFFLHTQTLQAASQQVKISSCKLGQKGKTLTVKAKVKKKTKAMGGKLYLIGLDACQTTDKAVSTTPLTSVKAKKGTVTFQIKYKPEVMACRQYAVAYKKGSKYQPVSNAVYIANPELAATYAGTGAKIFSKKGIQARYGEINDVVELGAQHVVMNWTINDLFADAHTTNIVKFKYQGKTYKFDGDELNFRDKMVSAYVSAGMQVEVIMLLKGGYQYASGADAMVYPGGSAYFSSINTSNSEGCRTWAALMTYLGKRYGGEDNLVSGWIIGNEVDSPGDYNYAGGQGLDAYMKQYADACRIASYAARSYNKNAKVYISLDHNWNMDWDGGGSGSYTTRQTLDVFHKYMGKTPYHIAYHAYSQVLSNPKFWEESDGVSGDENSTYITMKNINVLADYVKKHYGASHKILLSEQAYTYNYGEDLQAAALAYAFYLTEANDMLEGFVYMREYDEGDPYNWGLTDDAGRHRLAWTIFQQMDTKDYVAATSGLMGLVPVNAWTDIPGFNPQKFKKADSVSMGSPVITEIKWNGDGSRIIVWRPASGVDGYELYRNTVTPAGEEKYKKIATITDKKTTQYTDNKVLSGMVHNYKIRGFKKVTQNGKTKKQYTDFSEPMYTQIANFFVAANQKLGGIFGLRVAEWLGNDARRLTWERVIDADGYEIYRNGKKIATIRGNLQVTYDDTQIPQKSKAYQCTYQMRTFKKVNGKIKYSKYSEKVSTMIAAKG